MKYFEEVRNYVAAQHNALKRDETIAGVRLYDTFGEWKAANPNHPMAKKHYPDREYVQVIAAFKKYFDEKYADVVELDI